MMLLNSTDTPKYRESVRQYPDLFGFFVSILFPALAFGFPLLIGVMLGQFLAKTVGGALWLGVIEGVRLVAIKVQS